jgi:uncharacterized membrane protein
MGRIVGVSLDYEGYLLDENGALIDTFNPTGSTWTVPWNINESGTIVGHYEDNAFVHHGFTRKPDGTLTIVDDIVSGATDTALYGINDSGQIVGYYVDSQGSYHGFVDLRW